VARLTVVSPERAGDMVLMDVLVREGVGE